MGLTIKEIDNAKPIACDSTGTRKEGKSSLRSEKMQPPVHTVSVDRVAVCSLYVIQRTL
jgi:hypothetical protein